MTNNSFADDVDCAALTEKIRRALSQNILERWLSCHGLPSKEIEKVFKTKEDDGNKNTNS